MKYRYFLRNVVCHGIITAQHQQFLQYVQYIKSNSLQIEISQEDLDRASEPFHCNQETSSTNNNQNKVNINNIETNPSKSHTNEIIDMLTQKPNNEDELFDITNLNQLFCIHNMYIKQYISDYTNVPVMQTIAQNDMLYSSTPILVNRNFDNTPRKTKPTSNNEPIYIEPICMDQNCMTLIITNTERYNIIFEETGCTTPVNVQIAKGTAKAL
jgi:hypothetical protein